MLQVARATISITDWSFLALLLGLSEADYRCIVSDNGTINLQRKAIIIKWLQTGEASWAALVSALRDELVNEQTLANKIAHQHLLD